jgi:hypothetical protein
VSERCPACPPARLPRRRELGSASAWGALAVGVVPGSSGGVALHVAGRPDPHWGLSATALYVVPSEVSGAGTTLSVGLTSLGLAATFRPLKNGETLTLEAGPWVGALHSSTRISPDAAQNGATASGPSDFPYFAASLGASLEAHVSAHIFLSARGLLLANLLRREMGTSLTSAADGSTTDFEPVWTQPAAAALFSAGLGWSFF